MKYSVLDPVMNHNILDRQLTAISFASQSPLVITGDDYGAVSVFKICKNGGGYLVNQNEEQDTADGIINDMAKVPSSDASYQTWRSEEAKGLSGVISAKLSGMVQNIAPAAEK